MEDAREQQIRDELVRRVVGLDSARQSFPLEAREEDLIDALAEITDLSREEIVAVARQVRAQYQAPPAPRRRTWRRALLPLLGGVLVAALALLGRWFLPAPAPVPAPPAPSRGAPPPASPPPPAAAVAPQAQEAEASVPLDPAAAAIREAFLRCCPRPAWWQHESIRGVAINSYDDLLAYWQNKSRSKRQFFKAAYQAILDHPQDTDLVVTAIKLMPYGDSSYPHLRQLLEFAVAHYFHYRQPLANYGGMAGDTIAGIVEDLARIYLGQGEPERAVALIERLLKERGKEINDHMLELLALVHAQALSRAGRQAEAIAVLQHAIDAYHGDWEKQLRESLARYAPQKAEPARLR
ncbi:MAG: hypothetical protein KatS3mg131_3494 [Candidatus Tectimicrobiota bacterium]|nr:MAG: hypothetical protein KatS3mg131_3494 [Candidatus Tectomicrobia bacterium]